MSARVILLTLSLLTPSFAVQSETTNSAVQQAGDVMQQFVEREQQARQDTKPEIEADIKRKQRILFLMGAALLVSIFTTVGLGVAMALYNKPVFVAHMVCAGVSTTLALVHAIVAVVWFYPF